MVSLHEPFQKNRNEAPCRYVPIKSDIFFLTLKMSLYRIIVMGSLVMVLLVIMLFDEQKRPINRKKRSQELFRILRNPVCFRKCNKSAFIPLWDAERRLTENEVSKMIHLVQGDSTQIVLLHILNA